MLVLMNMLRSFGTSTILTIAAVIAAGWFFGAAAMITTVVLIAIEVAFSFDNAILNAKVLDRLSRLWQQLFLTVGMVIAILGMRLIFPVAIVSVAASLSWGTVVDLALHHPEQYAHYLEKAHVGISAFGGGFLLVLTLYFLLDDERDVLWLQRIERPLQRFGGIIWLPPLLVLLAILLVGLFVPERSEVLKAGASGIIAYTALKALTEGLGKLTGQQKATGVLTGWAALTAFLYLEVLDASFSFDGVLGAFAITDKVLLIALGLGVGALWVRSLTVFMVRRKTLSEYVYLEHGAHYAILVLAIALLASLFHEVPDAVTGASGLGIIFASFIASRQARRAHEAES